MTEQPIELQTDNKNDESLLTSIENAFDWNLIALMSVWIFLLATFFLIFIG